MSVQESEVDRVVPGDTWVFDAAVTDVFEDMLSRSIPGYSDMRRWVDQLLLREIGSRSSTSVLDLGASRGEVVARFADYPHCKFNLIEVSEPMRCVLRERFGARPNFHIYDLDIRYEHARLEDMAPDVVTSVLTTIFTPISYRQAIISSVQRALAPRRGTFIWVEKVLGDSAEGDSLLTEEYYKFKAAEGYSQEAIARKRLSLEFAQVPLTSGWNEDILRQAGFKTVQKFWQSWNFCGWVAQV